MSADGLTTSTILPDSRTLLLYCGDSNEDENGAESGRTLGADLTSSSVARLFALRRTGPEAGPGSAVFVAGRECNSKTRAGDLPAGEIHRNCASRLEAGARQEHLGRELCREGENRTYFRPLGFREDTALATGNCGHLQSCPPKLRPTAGR